MNMEELVRAIALKHGKEGITIYAPASENEISSFERKVGFILPLDFGKFYSVCNGFECAEDIFRMIPLEEVRSDDYGKSWFSFAEYMIFSDCWKMKKKENDDYEIADGSLDEVLGSSLHEFLEKFLQGNVFDKDGLYDWQNVVRKK